MSRIATGVIASSLIALPLLACVGDRLTLPADQTDGGSTPGLDGGGTCPAPLSVCAGACTNTTVDAKNCGACGTACAAGLVCAAGKCALECGSGLTRCEGAGGAAARCVDRNTDGEHCGACGTVCTAGRVCRSGACQAPTSCADIAATAMAQGKVPADGKYTIDPDGPTLAADAGGTRAPFEVYCHAMSSAPAEYLELPHNVDAAEPNANFVTYGGGGSCSCATTFRRAFTKVRLDVRTLTILPEDFTFAPIQNTPADEACWRSQGGGCAGAIGTAFGSGGSCGGSAGTFNVDLRDTPFSIQASLVWGAIGANPYGGLAVFGSGRKVVDSSGGGNCGVFLAIAPLRLERDP